MNSIDDKYYKRAPKWKEEFKALRAIINDCQLTEEMKWGWPSYSFKNGNVVLIHGFKEYCALLFFKGSLLNDSDKILIKISENMQAQRQIRFTNVKEIMELEPVIKTYIFEAIEVEKAGLKVEFKKTEDFQISKEFQIKLDEMPALKTAFEALTPGRQRAYLFHFAQAKQSKTREARVEKYIPQILNGKGLND